MAEDHITIYRVPLKELRDAEKLLHDVLNRKRITLWLDDWDQPLSGSVEWWSLSERVEAAIVGLSPFEPAAQALDHLLSLPQLRPRTPTGPLQ